MIDYSLLALKKPEPRKRVKARKARVETKVKGLVRAHVEARDGYCAIDTRGDAFVHIDFPACDGPSEWAHIGKHRRCHTRGMAPEERHTTTGSAKLCQAHHRAYDAHTFNIRPLTLSGMDGPFVVEAP